MSFKKYYTGGNKDTDTFKSTLSNIREDLQANDIIYLYDCDTKTYDYVISIKETQEDSFYSKTNSNQYFKPISKIYNTNSPLVLNSDKTILESYQTGFNYVLPIESSTDLNNLKNINNITTSISTIVNKAKNGNSGKGIKISLDEFQYGEPTNTEAIGNHIFKSQNSHIDNKYSYWSI